MRRIWMLLVAIAIVLPLSMMIRTLTYPWRDQLDVVPAERSGFDEQALARHLAEAVRFRTVSHENPKEDDPGQLVALRDWFETTYPTAHRTLKREIIGDYSLLYTWPGADPSLAPVIVLAHMDVVPVQADSESDWTYPPFAGVIADGYVWGRGTLDMKAILVGIMEAVEHQVALGRRPRRTIMLGFGHDEEVGGQKGAKQIVEVLKEREVRAHWVLDEGSAIVQGVVPGLDAPLALIGVAEKGYVTIDIVARAPGGHTSMPPYETAVSGLARAITTLQENPFSGGIEGVAAEMFRALGPHLPISYRAAIANQWLLGPYLERRLSASTQLNAILRTTIAPTMLIASPKDNILATEARATLNLRIHPRDSVHSVLEHVRNLVASKAVANDSASGANAIEIRVEMTPGSGFGNDPSARSSTDSDGYRLIEVTAREIYPDAIVSPYFVLAATDSRHYSDIAADIYRFGPFLLDRADLERPHGTNERIHVEGFANVVRFYIRLFENLNR